MQGPLCQYKYPLKVEDGTLCRMPSPLPGPEGAGAYQPEYEDADLPRNGDDLTMIFGGPAQDIQDASERAFWEVFDCLPDWAGTSIPTEFKMAVAGQIFHVKEHATMKLYQYAISHFAGPGTFDAELSFPMSALAGALERTVSEGSLEALIEGEIDRLGTEEEPFEIGDWQFSFEYGKGMVELFHAVYRGSGIA